MNKKNVFITLILIIFIGFSRYNQRVGAFSDVAIQKSQFCVGDVCNRFEIIDDEYYLIENLAQIILDGSENGWWMSTLQPNGTHTTSVLIPEMQELAGDYPQGYIKELDIFFVNRSNYSTPYTSWFNNERFYLILPNDFLPVMTINNFRDYLSQNPLTVTYELETPIQTKVTSSYVLSKNTIFDVFMDFDIGNVFNNLYNIVIQMTLYVSQFWIWLNENIVLNLNIPIIGEIWGLNITPLSIIGGVGILTIVTLWLIKKLVPVA